VLGLDTVRGHAVRPVVTGATEAVTIDLDASSAHDGTRAAGTFAMRYPNGDPEVRGRVVCLAVSGNKAMVGGVVQSASGSGSSDIPVGSRVLLSITDGGDRDSELTLFVLISLGCGVQDAIPEVPLSEGNFEIHDEAP
jgi:hypothetical protein